VFSSDITIPHIPIHTFNVVIIQPTLNIEN
jgi:hypothetical protein